MKAWLSGIVASLLTLALLAGGSVIGACAPCQGGLIPSDETYVPGCGCVDNPDLSKMGPNFCPSSSSGAGNYGGTSGWPTSSNDAGTDAPDAADTDATDAGTDARDAADTDARDAGVDDANGGDAEDMGDAANGASGST